MGWMRWSDHLRLLQCSARLWVLEHQRRSTFEQLGSRAYRAYLHSQEHSPDVAELYPRVATLQAEIEKLERECRTLIDPPEHSRDR